MAFITLTARLASDPQSRQTKTGTAMATGFCFAKLGQDSGDLALGIVAFGSVADELLNYGKGETLNLAGSLKVNVYQKDGQQVEQLQIMLDGIAGKNQTKQVRGQSRNGQESQPANGAGYGQSPTQMPPINQQNSGQYGARQHQQAPQQQAWQADQQFQNPQPMQAPRQARPAQKPPAPSNQFDDDMIPF